MNNSHEYIDSEDSFDISNEKINIVKVESEKDETEELLLLAEDSFNKMKFYCDYHGLDLFTLPSNICISNLMELY